MEIVKALSTIGPGAAASVAVLPPPAPMPEFSLVFGALSADIVATQAPPPDAVEATPNAESVEAGEEDPPEGPTVELSDHVNGAPLAAEGPADRPTPPRHGPAVGEIAEGGQVSSGGASLSLAEQVDVTPPPMASPVPGPFAAQPAFQGVPEVTLPLDRQSPVPPKPGGEAPTGAEPLLRGHPAPLRPVAAPPPTTPKALPPDSLRIEATVADGPLEPPLVHRAENAAPMPVIPARADGGPPQPDLPRQIASQLAEAARAAPKGEIEVVLRPEELGTVRLRLAPTEQGMIVHLAAERGETLDLIRRNLEGLLQDFRGLGFTTLGFAFGGSSARGQTAQGAPGGRLKVGLMPTDQVQPIGSGPVRIGESGRLDMRL